MVLIVRFMCWFREQAMRFREDIRGVSTVEYALIVVAVIAIVGVAAGLLGDAFDGDLRGLVGADDRRWRRSSFGCHLALGPQMGRRGRIRLSCQLQTMSWLGLAAIAAGVGFALAAVWTDIKRREVPHWIIGGLVTAWLAAVILEPEALDASPVASVVCGLLGLVLGFALHAVGWLGGGDGKLMAALALWLGPADIAVALLCTGLVGGLLLVLALARRERWRHRELPCAVAIVPPAATLLIARAVG